LSNPYLIDSLLSWRPESDLEILDCEGFAIGAPRFAAFWKQATPFRVPWVVVQKGQTLRLDKLAKLSISPSHLLLHDALVRSHSREKAVNLTE
jgi:hypothetical protein